MSIVVLVLAFLFIAVLSIAMALLLIFAFDSLTRGHDLPTSRRATEALGTIIRRYKPNAKNFYDLGCAHGDLSLAIKKILPGLAIHAVDTSAIRIFFAKLKSRILGRRINFKQQNLFKTSINQADVVYTYLWYDLMPLLEKKLQNELRPGAIVVTNTSNFPTWKPIHTVITCSRVSKTPDFETLFVYVV